MAKSAAQLDREVAEALGTGRTRYVGGRRLPKLSERRFVVALHSDPATGPTVYLGNIGTGRQGVRHLQDATRFTKVGAERVAAGYQFDPRARAVVIEVPW